MLRLITDGPGWTDDITFLKWENKENPGEFHLIGYNSGAGDIIAITEQSFEDAVRDLTSIHAWTNEEDGTSNYLEGDSPDDFNADYYGLDEDNLFEDSIDFDDVSDYLAALGYNTEKEDNSLFRSDVEDYLKKQGIEWDEEDDDDPVNLLLDEYGYYDEDYADYMYSQEDLDNIVNQIKASK